MGIDIFYNEIEILGFALDFYEQCTNCFSHGLHGGGQLTEIIFAVQTLFRNRFHEITLGNRTEVLHNLFHGAGNVGCNHSDKDNRYNHYHNTNSNHDACSLNNKGCKFLILCGNLIINVICVITGADYPVERFKICTVCTLRRRLGLSFLREYIIGITAAIFDSNTDNFLDHLESGSIRCLHTVRSLCITSE